MAFVAAASVALGSAATTARATCQYVLKTLEGVQDAWRLRFGGCAGWSRVL